MRKREKGRERSELPKNKNSIEQKNSVFGKKNLPFYSSIIHNLNKNFHLFSSIEEKTIIEIKLKYRTRAYDSYELIQFDTIEKKDRTYTPSAS